MNYELVYILSPKLSDDDAEKKSKEIVEQIKENITEIVLEDFWGKKDLAYPIDKLEHGYYTLVQFKAEAENINKINKKLKLDDEIIRYLIVKKEDFVSTKKIEDKPENEVKPDKESTDEDANFVKDKLTKETIDEVIKEPEAEVKDKESGEMKEEAGVKDNRIKEKEKKPKAVISDLDKKLDDILDSEIED